MSILDAKKCNACGSTFPGALHFCPNDGQPLQALESLIGKLLDGRYRIESLLGSGGMGVVYRATHIHLDTQVAVKILNPELVANQSAIERFRREARAAGRINHPNAIQVTDFGVTAEKIVYLVMEIVCGPSLREVIQQERAIDYRRAVSLMDQVCAAVEAAHQSGVIHRDLKPDNILIQRLGSAEKVKVLDFGIAKLREQTPSAASNFTLTEKGTIIGTPQYMSPEQCRGEELDNHSDIYSLGIILYEMLSGRIPFDGGTPYEIIAKHLKDAPRPVREMLPAVPESIERVVMRAIEKEPPLRQSSATELSTELRDAVEAEERRLSAETLPYALPTEPSAAVLTSEAPPSQSPSLAREPAVQPPLDAKADLAPAEAGPDRAGQAAGEIGRESEPAKSRMPVIALAAAILIAVIGLVAYFALKPTPPKPVVEPGKLPPEEMVLIPGGKFLMGRNDGDADEQPAHEVEVKAFYLDKYEVTNQQYKKFVEATGHPAPKNWKNNGSYALDEAILPVNYVTWQDAADYAAWAKKRLPTEAEWEYAARGGSQGLLYPWGSEWKEGYANVDRAKRTPIGSFEQDRTPFGIYDMAGNVSEWVDDLYLRYATKRPDPKCGGCRVYRGGNFVDDKKTCTATYRWYDQPTPPEDQLPKIGFRCAKDADR